MWTCQDSVPWIIRVILPRTVANAIHASVGGAPEQDHFEVSDAATSFIRIEAEERRTGRTAG
jgi:hypothetical protein